MIKNITKSFDAFQTNIQKLFEKQYDTVKINDNIHIKQLIEIHDLYKSIDEFLDMLASHDIENIIFDHEPFYLTNERILKKINTKTRKFSFIGENQQQSKLNINDLKIIIRELNKFDVLFKISKDTYTMFSSYLGIAGKYKIYDNPTDSFTYYTIDKWKFC